jgi:hypothetical protein
VPPKAIRPLRNFTASVGKIKERQSPGSAAPGKTRGRSKWLDDALKNMAMLAIRSNDSYLQAQY